MEEEFKGHGFVYWEETVSPDGRFRVLDGYSDGEKTPTLVEPRIIEIVSGAVVLDLWHTYMNYELEFLDAGKARLTIQDAYQTVKRIAEINLNNRTFSFSDSPLTQEPLSNLGNRVRS